MEIDKYKKTISIVISSTMFFLMIFQTFAFAGDLKFADLKGDKYNWVLPYIEKMTAANIVKGTTQNTYAPDAPVTRAQVVAMIVRLLGLEESAENKNLPTSFPKASLVPPWARGYVAIGVEKGIITGKDLSDFRADDSTKRYEVAIFAVKALGLSSEAESRKNVDLSFKDTFDIPLDARAYVQVAVEKDIVKGFPDSTFKPNDKVTRAQMTVILNNISKHLSVPNIAVGTVEDTDTLLLPSITMSFEKGGMKTYTVDKSTSVYREKNGNLVETQFSDIKNGDTISLVYSDDKALYIDIWEKTKDTPQQNEDTKEDNTEKNTKVEGTIDNLDKVRNIITVKQADGKKTSYEIENDVKIYIDNKLSSFRDLETGQKVVIFLGKTVQRVEALRDEKPVSKPSEDTIKAAFKAVITSADIIIVENIDTLEEERYSLATDVEVLRYDKKADLVDLRVGEYVILSLKNDKVVKIEAKDKLTQVKGTITDISFSSINPVITLEEENYKKAYELAYDVSILKNGRKADITDLREGDKVVLGIEYGKAVSIIAESKIEYISGILKVITIADNTTIVIEDKRGREYSLLITRNTSIYKDRRKIDVSELRRGYRLDIELEGDEAIDIDVIARETQDTIKGKIQNINPKLEIIVIKEGTTQELRYIRYTSDTLFLGGSDEISIRRLKEGDEILAIGELNDGMFYAETIHALTIYE